MFPYFLVRKLFCKCRNDFATSVGYVVPLVGCSCNQVAILVKYKVTEIFILVEVDVELSHVYIIATVE